MSSPLISRKLADELITIHCIFILSVIKIKIKKNFFFFFFLGGGGEPKISD